MGRVAIKFRFMQLVVITGIIGLLPVSPKANATTEELVFKKEKIAYVTPPVVNRRFFNLEFGFVTHKQFFTTGYHYNAFVLAVLAQESHTTAPALSVAALAGKGGILLPTNPWIPLYFNLAAGVGKTAYQHSPIFGDRDDTIKSDTMLFAEGGVVCAFRNRVLLRYNYQINNNKYFKRKHFIALGYNF